MFKAFLSSRRLRLVLTCAVACITLAGCLADNNPIVQVVPHLVLAPQNLRFQASTYVPGSYPPAGNMLVKWSRSIADTQLNFKGYFVKLWTSDTLGFDSTGSERLKQLLDSVHIGRTGTLVADTTCTFTSIPGFSQGVPMGRYTVVAYGEKATDTVGYSPDSSVFSANFDPRPIPNPTNLKATSVGPTFVRLHWTPSPMDTSSGFYRYIIYYVDTTKIDTGHAIATIVKPQGLADTVGWNDSSITVSVPGVTPLGSTTAEYPYMFWVKSQRIDSTIFYGTDTNHIVWAGAEFLPSPGLDSNGYGGIHNSIFIGSYNQHWAIVDDSNHSDMQVLVTINGNSVTLTARNRCRFLSDGSGGVKIDPTAGLDSIYYSQPYANIPPYNSPFNDTIVVLPTNPTSNGVVLYLMIPDPLLGEKPEWARLFIKAMSNRTFINSSNGIHVDVSFQPATSKDGGEHLPFY